MHRNQPPLKPGDLVEWNPADTWLRGMESYRGQTGVVIEAHGLMAMVRFADGAEHRLNVHHLTWLPTPQQIADGSEELRQAHLDYMRGVKWLHELPPGNPHEAPHLDAEAYHTGEGC